MKINSSTRFLPMLAVLAATVSGLWALAAWRLSEWRLMTFGPGYIPMAPASAFLFVLLGPALSVWVLWPASDAARLAGQAASLLALVAGSRAALQSWREFTLPWDGWLVGPPNRVSARDREQP